MRWDDIEGWFTLEEAKLLAQHVGPVTVELGSYLGRSTAVIATVTSKQLGWELFAIDRWMRTAGVHPAERFGEDYMATFIHNMESCGFMTCVRPLRLMTNEAYKLFGDATVDTVFHDASHDYASVDADLDLWLPKIKEGGVWAQHDTDRGGGDALEKRVVAGRLAHVAKAGTLRVCQSTVFALAIKAPNEMYTPDWYDKETQTAKEAAEFVLMLVRHKLRFESAVDVGCGTGAWLHVAKRFGATRVVGIDGPWVLREKLLIDPVTEFYAIDLSREGIAKRGEALDSVDLAICLEVAEHLPPDRADSLVHVLCLLSKVVLFSAATPGQGGEGHVNEQPLSYWVEKFAHEGYVLDDSMRPQLKFAPIASWYRNNIVMFRRQP